MPTIAVVANDRNVMTSVSVVLEAEGYRIAAYTDGVSALSGFQTAPPDLAILDIKMPRLDGAEALRLLRTKFSRSGKLRCPESGILGAPPLPAALELEADPSCADQRLDRVKVTPAEFGAYMKSETEKWATVIKAANIKAN